MGLKKKKKEKKTSQGDWDPQPPASPSPGYPQPRPPPTPIRPKYAHSVQPILPDFRKAHNLYWIDVLPCIF